MSSYLQQQVPQSSWYFQATVSWGCSFQWQLLFMDSFVTPGRYSEVSAVHSLFLRSKPFVILEM